MVISSFCMGEELLFQKLCKQRHFRSGTKDTKGFIAVAFEHSHLCGGLAFPHRISDFVSQCPECCNMARPRKEPLLPTQLPDYPWQKAGTDLFELKGVTYLLVVDYLS